MKILNLDQKTHEFYLWERKYTYTEKEEDKMFFLKKIQDFDTKNYDETKFLPIFKQMLIRENSVKYLNEKDIVGLFHFFVSIFLKKLANC